MTLHMIVHAPDETPLEQRRLALGYSRERLGAAAGGVSSATVRRIERGLVNPHQITRLALARALSCEVEEIFPAASKAPDGNRDLAKTADAGGGHEQG
jgi:DNA-binding XRE family transcriptional regulator